MRSYVDGHPVETTPKFRFAGRGRAVTSVSFSVPLRFEDLVVILYTSPLPTGRISDADAVRDAIADSVVNNGANHIAREKDLLRAKIRTRSHDPERLAACKSRITTLFPRAAEMASAKRNRWERGSRAS